LLRETTSHNSEINNCDSIVVATLFAESGRGQGIELFSWKKLTRATWYIRVCGEKHLSTRRHGI
jgi:hypothetical protein